MSVADGARTRARVPTYVRGRCQERASLEIAKRRRACVLYVAALSPAMTGMMRIHRRKWDEERRDTLESSLTLDFLRKIMDMVIRENFYPANRESFN